MMADEPIAVLERSCWRTTSTGDTAGIVSVRLSASTAPIEITELGRDGGSFAAEPRRADAEFMGLCDRRRDAGSEPAMEAQAALSLDDPTTALRRAIAALKAAILRLCA
jgi:hypothetical protein